MVRTPAFALARGRPRRAVATAGMTSSAVPGSPEYPPARRRLHSWGRPPVSSSTGPSPAARSSELPVSRRGLASRSASNCCTADPLANRASCRGQFRPARSDSAPSRRAGRGENRQRLGPLRLPAGDPPRGFLQTSRRCEPSCAVTLSRSRRPPSIWSRAVSAARRVRALGLLRPAAVASRIADLDQGVCQRVLQGTVGRCADSRQQGRHRGLIADATERLSSSTAVEQRTGLSGERVKVGKASASRRKLRPTRGRPAARSRLHPAGDRADNSASSRFLDPRGGPDGVAAGLQRGPRLDGFQQGGKGLAVLPGRSRQCLDSPPSDDRPARVAQERPLEPRGLVCTQVKLQTPRVVDLRRILAANAVDRPQHVRLVAAARSGSRACTSRRCRRRAGCRRRLRARRSDENRGCRLTRKSSSWVVKVAPLRVEDVPRDLVHVEQAGEQVVLIFRAEDRRLVARQAARGGGAEVRQDRHELRAGPLVVARRRRDPCRRRRRRWRGSGRRAGRRRGAGRTCVVKIRSPPGVKTTSTGLSMPPVITGSMPRAVRPAAEDVRGPRRRSGLPWAARNVCSANAPLHQ